MKMRYYNARILTGRKGESVFEGELWTKEDKICYLGDGKELSKEERGICGTFDREIDVKRNLILPGFKNSHTHSAMTFLRSYADDLPLDRWLHEQVFPMEAKLTGEDVYWFTRLAILEYISGGTTAAFDMYLYPEAVAKAAVDSGFRMVLCGAVNDFSESAEKLDGYYQRYNAYHPLISYQLGAHAEYTTQESIFKEIADLVEKYKAPFYSHIAETELEVKGCVERHGCTPTVYFAGLGLFEYGGGGFHCVYTTEEDRMVMKEKNLSVVTNAASNIKLASGIAPITTYQEEGINLGIGTDGPASNNALDMFREMYLVTALQKYLHKDASACPALDVLEMAQAGSARAMCLSDCMGLSVGKQADFMLFDLNQPNMQPENNIIKNIVYSGSKQNVKMTVVAGKVLYEDGQFFVGEDVAVVYQKTAEIMKRLKRS